MIYHDVDSAINAFINHESDFCLFNGDCHKLLAALPSEALDLVVTSPPYFMGKSYDTSYNVDDFVRDHSAIKPDVERIVKPNGNIAWQVGHHVKNGISVPLDFHVYAVFNEGSALSLRNRIVWTFNHGLHSNKRLSGRHETILWFSKGDDYFFDLDAIRVPQKYPGKRHYSGPKKGQWSGNPLGKNPGDVWDIPNVKANHPEKTLHPCQFPVSLVERLVKALAPTGGYVCDPFSGVGSSGIAAVLNGRRFLGAELDPRFCEIAETRYQQFLSGTLRVREDKPVHEPSGNEAVAVRPDHFLA